MIDVFRARKIITMNDSWPEGEAVAVRDGRILEVGKLERMSAWLDGADYTIRDDFADKVLMPGLIDPHLHPLMAAVLLPMQFITAMEWRFPWETVEAVTTPPDYLAALRRHRDKQRESSPPGTPFFTWGYHRHWHGEMGRPLLDELFGDQPAVVWQRSFHEVYLNTAMMKRVGIDDAKLAGRHQIDVANGHFFENGLGYAINKLNPILMSNEWLDLGLGRLARIAHFGGHTSLGDMAVGIFDVELEWASCQRVLDHDDTPFRVVSVPHAMRLGAPPSDPEAMVALAEKMPERNTRRFRFGRKIKLFTDGAFFSQLAMMLPPGYTDGHEGEWLIPPEQYERVARAFWNAGFQIHVHCTGDLGLELAIETLEKLQAERPRFGHGYTIEHFGFSTSEQVRRLSSLGADVSANPYYLHELSDAYGSWGIGVERAEQMVRLGSCDRFGMPWTIHSDFPMAPAAPLANAWVAATRQNACGDVVAPEERVGLVSALRAITVNAARVLGIDAETGSIRAGKSADFCVLDEDPYAVGVDGLRDLKVLATVFEARVFETERG